MAPWVSYSHPGWRWHNPKRNARKSPKWKHYISCQNPKRPEAHTGHAFVVEGIVQPLSCNFCETPFIGSQRDAQVLLLNLLSQCYYGLMLSRQPRASQQNQIRRLLCSLRLQSSAQSLSSQFLQPKGLTKSRPMEISVPCNRQLLKQ